MTCSSPTTADLPQVPTEGPLSEEEAVRVLNASYCDVRHSWDYVDYFVVEGPSIRVTLVGTPALTAFALGVRFGSRNQHAA